MFDHQSICMITGTGATTKGANPISKYFYNMKYVLSLGIVCAVETSVILFEL